MIEHVNPGKGESAAKLAKLFADLAARHQKMADIEDRIAESFQDIADEKGE